MAMRHWGIKRIDTGGWLRFANNEIFWTTSFAVAMEQFRNLGGIDYAAAEVWEVAEFPFVMDEKLKLFIGEKNDNKTRNRES